MALTVDNTSLWLASGYMLRGVWTNPETIGTDNIRFRDKFNGTQVGTIKAGTQITNLPKTYVEAKTRTPQTLFRKDVIEQPFMIEGEIFEYTGDALEIFLNREAQLGYSITSPAETWDLIHVGSSGPPMVSAGYLIRAVDVNDREVEVAQYAGLNTPEGQAVNMQGTDYAILQFKLEATEVAAITDSKKNYGYLARRTA